MSRRGIDILAGVFATMPETVLGFIAADALASHGPLWTVVGFGFGAGVGRASGLQKMTLHPTTHLPGPLGESAKKALAAIECSKLPGTHPLTNDGMLQSHWKIVVDQCRRGDVDPSEQIVPMLKSK